jgi:hypothetical protein
VSDARTDNCIGDAGALALAEALKVNRTLTSLNLFGTASTQLVTFVQCLVRVVSDAGTENGIRDAGAQALAEALRENRRLTNLTLFLCSTSVFFPSTPIQG